MDNTPIVEIDNMRPAPDQAVGFADSSPFTGVSSDPETGASVSTRYRRAEISDLARSLLMEASGRLGTEPKGLEDDAASLLAALPWRGSVAELRSVIEILAVTMAGPLVRVDTPRLTRGEDVTITREQDDRCVIRRWDAPHDRSATSH